VILKASHYIQPKKRKSKPIEKEIKGAREVDIRPLMIEQCCEMKEMVESACHKINARDRKTDECRK